MKNETWEITGNQTVVQNIHDPASDYKLTREFNFSDRDISTSVERGGEVVQSSYEVFHQADKQMVQEAAAHMQRLDRAAKVVRQLAQQREMLGNIVVNAGGLAQDISAPDRAKFRKKNPSAG